MERRLRPDQEVVDRLERLVLRKRERVLFRLLDDVGAVPSDVLDLDDRVTSHARQALLRLPGVVGELRLRGRAHLPGEQDDRMVATRAPLRSLATVLVR